MFDEKTDRYIYENNNVNNTYTIVEYFPIRLLIQKKKNLCKMTFNRLVFDSNKNIVIQNSY